MKKFLLLLLFVTVATGQLFAQRSVSGKVTDAGSGLPLVGASVVVTGTTTGTVTDFDGKYSLSVPSGYEELTVSFLGYQSQIVRLGASNVVDVELAESSIITSEVVVTALGLKTKRDESASSTSQISGAAVGRSNEAGVINRLAGKAAGVNITTSSGEPGAGSYIQIRGQSTITGNLQPLIVVNGIPISNSENGSGFTLRTEGTTLGSRLNDLNPEDIESIEVLKGASAAALWGTRAANGVIMITTKKGANVLGTDKKVDVNFRTSVSFDQVNRFHPLQKNYGQGTGGNYNPASAGGLTWGDKIADRPGGPDLVVDAPGKYFSATGADLFQGYFEAEDGSRYYRITPGGTAVFDAQGNQVIAATDKFGGKRSRDVYDHATEAFRTGHYVDNVLSISGGDARSNYYLSIGNLTQQGVIKNNSSFDRKSIRFSSDKAFSNILRTSVNAAYSRSKTEGIQKGSNLAGLLLGTIRTSPDFDNSDYIGDWYRYNADGSYTAFLNRQRSYRNYLGSGANPVYNNPFWTINEQENISAVDRYTLSGEIKLSPVKWFDLTTRLGVDGFGENRTGYWRPGSAGAESLNGRYIKELFSEAQFDANIFGRAAHNFTKDIGLEAVVGMNFNHRQFNQTGNEIRSFTLPDAPANLTNTTPENVLRVDYKEIVRTAAAYGTVGLQLYDQIFTNFTLRAESASTFGADADPVFYYPSAEVAWQFSKLVPQNDAFSFGKLRVTYGSVGVQPGAYLTATNYLPAFVEESWGPDLDGNLYGGTFSRSNIQGNPLLGPERKTEFEVGTDLRFWKNRASLSATYYQNKTTDAILLVATAPSTGYTDKWDNAAELENKGIELQAGVDVIQKRDFNWNIGFNWTRNRNKVLDLTGTTSLFLNGFTGTSSRAVVGYPIGVLWGVDFARNDDGSLILDSRGFPQAAEQESVLGDPNPDWFGSANTTLTWKGLSFYAQFDASVGGDIWSGTRGVLDYFGVSEATGVESVASTELNRYGSGTIAAGTAFRGVEHDFGGGVVALDENWYRNLGGGFGAVSSQFIDDASWYRLREVALSYRFDGQKLRNATKLDNIELGLSGRNLLLITDVEGIDPETNLTGASNGRGLEYFNNPNTRSFIVSLKINY